MTGSGYRVQFGNSGTPSAEPATMWERRAVCGAIGG